MGGISSSRAPERSSATSRSNDSGVWPPTKRWLTWTQGVRSQSARHSASSRVMAPSGVVPPVLTPSETSAWASSSSRPSEQAGDVGADRDQVLPDRFGVEHVVEGGGAEHLGRGHAHQLADVLHGLGGEPAVLLLGQVAERDERRAGLGVELDQPPGPLHLFRREVMGRSEGGSAGRGRCRVGRTAHRSTSPITGSMVEQTATASAKRPPRIITGRAWRLTKLGPRMCIRYGLGVPSETR